MSQMRVIEWYQAEGRTGPVALEKVHPALLDAMNRAKKEFESHGWFTEGRIEYLDWFGDISITVKHPTIEHVDLTLGHHWKPEEVKQTNFPRLAVEFFEDYIGSWK